MKTTTEYFVRIQVDGAESPLESGSGQRLVRACRGDSMIDAGHQAWLEANQRYLIASLAFVRMGCDRAREPIELLPGGQRRGDRIGAPRRSSVRPRTRFQLHPRSTALCASSGCRFSNGTCCCCARVSSWTPRFADACALRRAISGAPIRRSAWRCRRCRTHIGAPSRRLHRCGAGG